MGVTTVRRLPLVGGRLDPAGVWQDDPLGRALGNEAVTEVLFRVDSELVPVSEPEARALGERLRLFAAGDFQGDVDYLAAMGAEPEWLEDARALADAIEGVRAGTREGPIPLDPAGKAASAAFAALALSPPVSFDAMSGLARLYDAIRKAR